MSKEQWIRSIIHTLNTPVYRSRRPDKTGTVPYIRFRKGEGSPDPGTLGAGGNLWYDEGTEELKFYDIATTTWIVLADKAEVVPLLETAVVQGMTQFTNAVSLATGTAGTATSTLTQLGASTGATAEFQFISNAVADSTITLISADTTSKTYIGKTDGTVTNGSLDFSTNYVQFNIGTDATEAANNLKLAMDSANGHNPPATAGTLSFTFGDTEFDTHADVELELTSDDGTNSRSVVYRCKNDGTADPDVTNHFGTAEWVHTSNPSDKATVSLRDARGTEITYMGSIDSLDSNGDIGAGLAQYLFSGSGTDGATISLIDATGIQIDYIVDTGGGSNGDLIAASTPTITFTDSATEDATIQLQSTDGVVRVYVAKTVGTAGDIDGGNAARIIFPIGSSATDSATNLETAIEHANGHNGKITVSRSTNALTLTQYTAGTGGNTSVVINTAFGNNITYAPATFMDFAGGATVIDGGASSTAYVTNFKTAVEHSNGHNGTIVGTTSSAAIFLKQATGGIAGNTPITTNATFQGDTAGAFSNDFIHGGETIFEIDGSALATSIDNLEEAINHANGHNGTIIVTRPFDAQVIKLTQTVGGSSGNTDITMSSDFSANLGPNYPSKFTGGGVKEFNAGSNDDEITANFVEAVRIGHQGRLTTTLDGTDITILQSTLGAGTNTTVGKPYSTALDPGVASFTFGDTEHDGTNNHTIQLESTDGTSVTYKIKNDGTAVSGSQEYNSGATAADTATNFKALVESSDGHGIKATTTFTFDTNNYNSINGAYILLTDAYGVTKRFIIKNDGTAVAANGEFNASVGASATATNFKTIVEGSDGFGDTSSISVSVSTAPLSQTVTITQEVTGSAGNTDLLTSGDTTDWSNLCSTPTTFPDVFTGGDNKLEIALSSTGDGGVTITQSKKGWGGNTGISYAGTPSILESGAPGTFIRGGGEAFVTFSFGDTEHDDVNNVTLELINYLGDSVTYKIKNDGTAVASRQEFNTGIAAANTAANFKTLVEGDNGSKQTIFVLLEGGGQVTAYQTAAGAFGRTPITASTGPSSWDDICDINPPSQFNLFTIDDICDTNPPTAFSGGADLARRIVSKVNTMPGQVELQQEIVSTSAGNTTITVSSSPDFDPSTTVATPPGVPTAFTGGSTMLTDLNSKTIILADMDSNSHTLTYDSSASTSTTSTIAIQNLTSVIDVAEQVGVAISLARQNGDINISSGTSGDDTVALSMLNAGTAGNGTMVTGTAISNTLISVPDFAGGLSSGTTYVSFDPTNQRVGIKNAAPAVELDVTGAVNITGDLTVGGTTTTVNSTVVTLDDPILVLGGDTAPASDDSKDRGIEFRYFKTTAKTGFMGWDSGTEKFVLLTDTSNASEVITGTAGILVGDLEGDVTGDVSGTAATVTGAAQTSITSLGTLDYLTIDNDLTITGGDIIVSLGNIEIAQSGRHLEFPDGTRLNSTQAETIGIRVDNGSSALTTGVKGHRVLPYDCEIVEWTLTSTDTGNVDFEINWCTYANYPTTASAHAHHSYSPNLSSANKATSGTLTLSEWTTYQFSAGDILEFEIQSSTTPTVTNATLSVRIRRTV